MAEERIAADPNLKDENNSATLNSQKSKISWFAVLSMVAWTAALRFNLIQVFRTSAGAGPVLAALIPRVSKGAGVCE